MEIRITVKGIGSNKLIQRLEGLPDWDSQDIRLIVRKREEPFRAPDPTVAVAIVSTMGVGLGALITGVLQLALESKKKVIVLQDKDGRRLEFPADCPQEERLRLVEMIRNMEEPRIEVAQ